MYEIGKEKVVKLNVGNNVVSQEPVFFKMQNVLIAGLSGSGIMKAVDNIVLNLTLNYSPMELGIQFYSYEGYGLTWSMRTRKLPHMINQSYDDSIDPGKSHAVFYENICNCLAAAVAQEESLKSYDSSYDIEYPCKNRKNVVILSLEHEPVNDVKKAITALIAYTNSHDCNVNVVVIAHYYGEFINSLAQYAGLRIATRVSPRLSRFMFGHIIETDDIKGGYAWVMERDNPYLLQCLSVPFRPDTLCGKVCKFLSNNKEYGSDKYQHVLSNLKINYKATMHNVLTEYKVFCRKLLGTDDFKENFMELDNLEVMKLLVDCTMEEFSISEYSTDKI